MEWLVDDFINYQSEGKTNRQALEIILSNKAKGGEVARVLSFTHQWAHLSYPELWPLPEKHLEKDVRTVMRQVLGRYTIRHANTSSYKAFLNTLDAQIRRHLKLPIKVLFQQIQKQAATAPPEKRRSHYVERMDQMPSRYLPRPARPEEEFQDGKQREHLSHKEDQTPVWLCRLSRGRRKQDWKQLCWHQCSIEVLMEQTVPMTDRMRCLQCTRTVAEGLPPCQAGPTGREMNPHDQPNNPGPEREARDAEELNRLKDEADTYARKELSEENRESFIEELTSAPETERRFSYSTAVAGLALACALVFAFVVFRPTATVEFAMADTGRATDVTLPKSLTLDFKKGLVEVHERNDKLAGPMPTNWVAVFPTVYQSPLILTGKDAAGTEGVFSGTMTVTNAVGVPTADNSAKVTGVVLSGGFRIGTGATNAVQHSYVKSR